MNDKASSNVEEQRQLFNVSYVIIGLTLGWFHFRMDLMEKFYNNNMTLTLSSVLSWLLLACLVFLGGAWFLTADEEFNHLKFHFKKYFPPTQLSNKVYVMVLSVVWLTLIYAVLNGEIAVFGVVYLIYVVAANLGRFRLEQELKTGLEAARNDSTISPQVISLVDSFYLKRKWIYITYSSGSLAILTAVFALCSLKGVMNKEFLFRFLAYTTAVTEMVTSQSVVFYWRLKYYYPPMRQLRRPTVNNAQLSLGKTKENEEESEGKTRGENEGQ